MEYFFNRARYLELASAHTCPVLGMGLRQLFVSLFQSYGVSAELRQFLTYLRRRAYQFEHGALLVYLLLELYSLFEESQSEGGEYQHDADVGDEPLPEPVSEEQQIDGHDDGYHDHYQNCEQYLVCTHACIVAKEKLAIDRQQYARTQYLCVFGHLLAGQKSLASDGFDGINSRAVLMANQGVERA